MLNCQYRKDIEPYFDGELPDSTAMQRHLGTCPKCTAHLEQLESMRGGLRNAIEHAEISDAQLPAFMEGIREHTQRPARRHTGLWAMASAAAAAVIVAGSLLYVMSPQKAPVSADTIIEESSTDINGATTETFISDDGTATVWVNVPDGDMW